MLLRPARLRENEVLQRQPDGNVIEQTTSFHSMNNVAKNFYLDAHVYNKISYLIFSTFFKEISNSTLVPSTGISTTTAEKKQKGENEATLTECKCSLDLTPV